MIPAPGRRVVQWIACLLPQQAPTGYSELRTGQAHRCLCDTVTVTDQHLLQDCPLLDAVRRETMPHRHPSESQAVWDLGAVCSTADLVLMTKKKEKRKKKRRKRRRKRRRRWRRKQKMRMRRRRRRKLEEEEEEVEEQEEDEEKE